MNADRESRPSITEVPPASRPRSLADRVRSLRLSDNRLSGGSRAGWLPWTLCLLLGIVVVVLAVQLSSIPDKDADTDDSLSNKDDRDGGFADDPRARSGEIALQSKGFIVPAHPIKVIPEVDGLVLKMYIQREGQRFNKGEMLAILDSTQFQTKRRSAEARAIKAQADLEAAAQRLLALTRGSRPEEIKKAQAELEEAVADEKTSLFILDRAESLMRKKAIANEDYDKAFSLYTMAAKRVQSRRENWELIRQGPRIEMVEEGWANFYKAQGDLTDAIEMLADADWYVQKCFIRAPIDGIILKKVEEWEQVNPRAFNVSANVCEMADLRDLEVDLNIQERDIAKVEEGQRCAIRPEAYPKRQYQGTVARIMPTGDRAKGSVSVRVKVSFPENEEPGRYLRPEMSALVTFYNK